jgi:hypothetical protein
VKGSHQRFISTKSLPRQLAFGNAQLLFCPSAQQPPLVEIAFHVTIKKTLIKLKVNKKFI